MNSAVCLFLLAYLLTGAQCRPNGAPNSACAGVGPNPISHGATPQISTVPYVLTGLPTNGNYSPGMSYTGNCLLFWLAVTWWAKCSYSVSLVYRTVQSKGSLRPAAVYGKVVYFQIKHCRHDESDACFAFTYKIRRLGEDYREDVWSCYLLDASPLRKSGPSPDTYFRWMTWCPHPTHCSLQTNCMYLLYLCINWKKKIFPFVLTQPSATARTSSASISICCCE